MLAEFDTYESCKIVEDSVKDMQQRGGADVMAYYGGTELPGNAYQSDDYDEQE